jgi:phenylalanyl-tRNA synthetase alpha chain
MQDISSVENQALEKLSSLSAPEDLEAFRIEYLGKKGKVTELMKHLGTLPPEEKAGFGKAVNALKAKLEEAFQAKRRSSAVVHKKHLDLTLPGIRPEEGRYHPLTQTLRDILKIFEKLGFEIVDGREIETEFYNFTALNIPLDHPSRDAFDTFYTETGHLLRSQTSTVQIRVMENRKPPLRIVAPGRVYRPDTVDATHSFMFHQVEGLFVDSHVTFSDLKGVLSVFARELFGSKSQVRFRPHFFPFTEPSVEVDVANIVAEVKPGSHTKWLEILGAGCVHPKVFERVGYDPAKVQGFAFGLGVERIAMLRYGIHDIRYFFENDVRFLRQFP